uniref:Uncharacterized protein n=1 Tax=Arundo donax TaxID=35708 RepID=A0A0A9FC73_ARUDO
MSLCGLWCLSPGSRLIILMSKNKLICVASLYILFYDKPFVYYFSLQAISIYDSYFVVYGTMEFWCKVG